MIKTNMLQLGDYVLSGKDKKVSIIASLNNEFVLLDYPDNDGYYFESKEKYLEPIPITEDLLKEIGFKYEDDRDEETLIYYIEDSFIEYNINNGYFLLSDFGRYYDGKLNYLHELQQAVRLVTKKELTIKL